MSWQVGQRIVADATGATVRGSRIACGAQLHIDVAFRFGPEGRRSFSERYLRPAIAAGLVEMTIPDKPNSRLQRYRLTDAGKARLAKTRGGVKK